jgi:hypothetical protein
VKILQHQAEALVRLRENTDFRALMEILNSRAEALNTKLIMKDDVNTDLTRGELRAYARIQDDLTNAPNLLAQYKTGYTEEHVNGAPESS